MKNEELLTNELVKHTLSIFGLAIPFIPNILGITFDKFKKSEISIEYDEVGKKTFPIYSASMTEKHSKIKVAAVFLSSDRENYEFCAVFKCDDLPIYGLKMMSDDDLGVFVVLKENSGWSKPLMHDKLLACAGLELLNSLGIVWKSEPLGDFLHRSLLDVVEM